MSNDYQLLVNARVTAAQLHRGVVTLAIVTNVRSTNMIVNLPFGLTGSVNDEDAMDSDEVRPLTELYKAGDYIIGIVVGQDPTGRPILGIKPSLFYQRGFTRKALVICQIETIEDHGWLAEVKDARETMCFLSKARVPEELHHKLRPGIVVQCAIIDGGSNGKLLQLSLQKIDLMASISFLTYSHLMPGQIIKAEVLQTTSTHSVAKLISSAGPGFTAISRAQHPRKHYGYILSEHVRRPRDHSSGYATYAGFTGKFRIIYVDLNPQTTDTDEPLIYLTNLDSVLDYTAPVQIYSVGQILQERKLTMVQTLKGAIFAALDAELASFVYIPAESTNHGVATETQYGERIDLKAKIVGYRQFDDLYIGSVNPNDITYSTEAEYHSGMILDKNISAKVTKVLDNGVHVSIEVSPTRTLHGMINYPHYGSHLKNTSIPLGLNINKGHGTLRVIAYDEPRQVYYLSLANLGSEPLFSSRDTVRPGMVSCGVVTSFIDSSKCAAVVQFTNLYSAVCPDATGMEIGRVYEFICVRNDDKYTTVDRLSESQKGDNIVQLRQNYAKGLMRVLEYRHYFKFEMPYSYAVDGDGDKSLPFGTILNNENCSILIQSIALGGFKLDVQMTTDKAKRHIFLPHNCIVYPGVSAKLINLYIGNGDNGEKETDEAEEADAPKGFFSILPFIRILTFVTTRDNCYVYLAAASPFLADNNLILPQENTDMVKGTISQAIVTHKSEGGLYAKLGAKVDIHYPDFGGSELTNVFPLTLIQIRPVRFGSKRTDREIKVDVNLIGYCHKGMMKGITGYHSDDEAITPVTKNDFSQLSLPQTKQLNDNIFSPTDCKPGMILHGSYLFTNTSPDACCAIYDLGNGVVGRMTFETLALSQIVAKIAENPLKASSLDGLLDSFGKDFSKFVAGGNLTMTAFFEKHLPQASKHMADVAVRDVIALYGSQELSTICADTNPTGGEQFCDILDLAPSSLVPASVKPLQSLLSKAGYVSLAMVRYVSVHHMVLRDLFDNGFVFVHAVDVFQDPVNVKPLKNMYAPGHIVPLSSITSKDVPCSIVTAGISRISTLNPLEASLLSSPMNKCSIAMVKPPNMQSGLQRTMCQVLPSGAMKLNGHSSMCFLTATSPVSFSGKYPLFMSPVLSITRLFNDAQNFADDVNGFINGLVGYHKCIRIGPDNVSIRPVDFQVSSMAKHSFISIGQEGLFLPQILEDISIHDTYTGFVQPYLRVAGGINVVVSESITLYVRMKEISEEFISADDVQSKYPPYTKVRIRYLNSDTFSDIPQHNGTIKPSVVNNPNIKHPSVVIKSGACLIGRVDNVLDDRGVFITVEDCYPLTRVRARISDAIDVTGMGSSNNSNIVLNNAAKCSNSYYRGQRLYFMVLEPTDKGASVGLKAAHFLAAGIDIAKLPVLKQERVRQSRQDKLRIMHQDKILKMASEEDGNAIAAQARTSVANTEPLRKRSRTYNLFAGEMDEDDNGDDQNEREHQGQGEEHPAFNYDTNDNKGSPNEDSSSDSDQPATHFLNFNHAANTRRDNEEQDSDYDILEDNLLEGITREYESRRPQKLTTEQKRVMQEKDIREKEEELLTNAAPQTEADFERLLAGNEQSSYLWIRYVAFHVDRANIDKAEAVMDRAITKVSPDKEMDYRNIWLARVALKERFSGPDAGLNELHEAMRRNDPNELLRIYCTGKLEQGDWDAAERGYGLLLSKKERKRIYENWRAYFLFLYNTKQYPIPDEMLEANRARARNQEFQKASNCLPQDLVLRLYCDIARAEYKIGDIDRGRAAFDKLVGNASHRMDIWGQYFDMEEKYVAAVNPQHIRALYERCCALKLSLKRMSYVIKRFYAFEKRYGTHTTQEKVKEIARAYADS